MRTKSGAAAGAALLAGVTIIAGCSASPGTTASPGATASPGTTVARVSPSPSQQASFAAVFRSPGQATLSWFYAINHKDKADALAHFTRAAAPMMNWGNGDTSTWSTFSALHCRPAVTHSALTASVTCTFVESQAPSVGNPVSFWTVGLTRQPDGRWLIDNYGQG